jgi:hypothetical protein
MHPIGITVNEGCTASLLVVGVVVSGLLLMPLLALAVLTGYCMKYPSLVEALTLGLLEGYAHCSNLHSAIVPGPLSLAAGLHAFLTAEATAARLKASRTASAIFLAYRILAWLLASALTALGLLDIAGLL